MHLSRDQHEVGFRIDSSSAFEVCVLEVPQIGELELLPERNFLTGLTVVEEGRNTHVRDLSKHTILGLLWELVDDERKSFTRR